MPEQLAVDILKRSICRVQVGAVLADSSGIISWGWNGVHTGDGIHAEAHAISRTSKKRLGPSTTIYVASVRKANNKVVNSKPCSECSYLIGKHGLKVVYRDASGEWISL